MANRRYRFVGFEKMANQILHVFVKTQVFRCTATRHHQCVIVRRSQPIKIRIQGKSMARLFCVGLVALEVMDGCGNGIARFFIRANGMNRVADGLQCLKRHHGFVIFGEITGNHQNLLPTHGYLLMLVLTSLETVAVAMMKWVLRDYYKPSRVGAWEKTCPGFPNNNDW